MIATAYDACLRDVVRRRGENRKARRGGVPWGERLPSDSVIGHVGARL